MILRELFDLGRVDEAVGFCSELLSNADSVTDDLHRAGILASKAGLHQLANRLIDRAIVQRPDDADLYCSLGEVARADGPMWNSFALKSFHRALDIDAACVHALRALTEIYRDRADVARALVFANAWFEVDSDSAPPCVALASLLRQSGRPGEAEMVLSRATSLGLEATEVYVELAQACHQLEGRAADAERAVQRALTLCETNPHAHVVQGDIRLKARKTTEALACYQRAVQARRQSSEGRGYATPVSGSLRLAKKAANNTVSLSDRKESKGPRVHKRSTLRSVNGIKSNPTVAPSSMNHAVASNRSSETTVVTTRSKLRHDHEQLQYLRDNGIFEVSPDQIAAYQEALAEAPKPSRSRPVIQVAGERGRQLLDTHGRLLHTSECDKLAYGALSRSIDLSAVAAELERPGGVSCLDDFLQPEALELLRTFCLESTVWFEFVYDNGYVGSMMRDGFCAPLLGQIADELSAALPSVLGAHPLRQMWAYKYDSAMDGIRLHADEAAVNVNFWITPDDANLDPSTGGMIIWDTPPPPDWGAEQYNNPAKEPSVRKFLVDAGALAIHIPHRANRAVVFDSTLFHETDKLRFAPGYENRRVNVTLLYGDAPRQEQKSHEVRAATHFVQTERPDGPTAR